MKNAPKKPAKFVGTKTGKNLTDKPAPAAHERTVHAQRASNSAKPVTMPLPGTPKMAAMQGKPADNNPSRMMSTGKPKRPGSGSYLNGKHQ